MHEPLHTLLPWVPHRLPAGALGSQALAAQPPKSCAERGAHETASTLRQRRHSAGRAAALDALARMGLAPNVRMGQAVDALPRRPDGGPTWPCGVIGSITHTPWASHAVVAPRRLGTGLGIDSQAHLTPQAAAELLTVCADADERARVAAQADPVLATGLLFSAKEAFFKALRSTDPRAMEFDAVTLRDCTRAADGHWALRMRPAPFLAQPDCLAWVVVDGRAVHATVLLGVPD